MFNKELNEFDLSYLTTFLGNTDYREGQQLEYKSKVETTDSSKKEFSKDVSAIANAAGGYLFIGIEADKDGIPQKLCGVSPSMNNTGIEDWIVSVINSNTYEILKYQTKIIELEEQGKIVLVLHIPESHKKPHMVTTERKNQYFIRHHAIVDVANHNEIKEMFEFTAKNRDEFESLMNRRNLNDVFKTDFAVNDNSVNLIQSYGFDPMRHERSWLLCSCIPRYLKEDSFDVLAKDYTDFLNNHWKGFEPAPHVYLTNPQGWYNKIVLMDGILSYDTNNEGVISYFEIKNDGFIESGLSSEVTYFDEKNQNRVFRLSSIIGYSHVLLNFILSFYNYIPYLDEFIFQISITNTRGSLLGNLGYDSTNHLYKEPYELLNNRPPMCRQSNIRAFIKLNATELNDNGIKSAVQYLSTRIARAFRHEKALCFDEYNVFRPYGLNSFR